MSANRELIAAFAAEAGKVALLRTALRDLLNALPTERGDPAFRDMTPTAKAELYDRATVNAHNALAQTKVGD